MIGVSKFTANLGIGYRDPYLNYGRVGSATVNSNRTLLTFDDNSLNFGVCYDRLKAALRDPEVRDALQGVKVSDGPHGKLIHVDNVAFLQRNGVLQADKEGSDWTPAQIKDASNLLLQLDRCLEVLDQIQTKPGLFGEMVGKALMERSADGGFELNFVATAKTEKELAEGVAAFADAVTK